MAENEFVLLDRQAERAAVDHVLDTARGGFSSTLVLRGGPGVGKTTMLRYAIGAAPDLRVSGITGIESEVSIAFAGLYQLLIPFLPLLGQLPPAQRHALLVAFGQDSGPPPERLLVGLATLTLLSLAAEEQPLLCVIDDTQWLDPESAHVLGFAACRLYADRVGLVAATSEGALPGAVGQWPTLDVAGLPDAEARDLLDRVAGPALRADVADRILAEARNNPLALIELGTEYAAGQPSGGAALPEPLPRSGLVQQPFLRQVRDLPPQA